MSQAWCDFCERMAEVAIIQAKTAGRVEPSHLCEDCRGEFSSVDELSTLKDVKGLQALQSSAALALAELLKEDGGAR